MMNEVYNEDGSLATDPDLSSGYLMDEVDVDGGRRTVYVAGTPDAPDAMASTMRRRAEFNAAGPERLTALEETSDDIVLALADLIAGADR